MWNDSPARPVLGEPVDAAEAERLVADVELGQAGQAGPDHDVALGPGLEGAAPAEVEHRLEHAVGLGAHGSSPRRRGRGTLLFLDVSMFGHVSPFLRRCDGRTIDSSADRAWGSRRAGPRRPDMGTGPASMAGVRHQLR